MPRTRFGAGASQSFGMFGLCLAVCVSLSGCKSEYPGAGKPSAGNEKQPPKRVKVVKVVKTPLERNISLTGSLAAFEQTTLTTKVAGRLTELNVDLGTAVKKGQTVAVIDRQPFVLRVQQAEAAVAQARARLGLPPDGADDQVEPENTALVRQAKAVLTEAELNRNRSKTLVEQGVVSRSEVDRTEAAYQSALARRQDALEEIRNRQALLAQRRTEVEIAKQDLADTTIVAPFDGVVSEKRAVQSDFLPVNAPIAVLVKINPLRLQLDVPEREAVGIKQNQPVNVTVSGIEGVFSGAVKRISPAITRDSRVLTIEAEIANDGRLRPGSFVRADIATAENEFILTVPSSAVATFAGIDKVFMVKDGKTVERPVTLGRNIRDLIEIQGGLKEGDSVVSEPGNLQPGQQVEAEPK